MGEASGHGPSEFSIVHDSIRRDREALFEGTRRVRARSLSTRAPSSLRLQIFSRDRSTRTPDARAALRLTLRPRAPPIPTPQFIPSIEADSDDDGSSDGELPIFFTSTEPGAPSSSAARHGADSTSSGATHTARAAPVHRDESDELAAFERAASEALRREEERSARIVAAHLAPDEHHHRHPPDDDDDDDPFDDSDSDSDAARGSVRARPRRAPRPATARRAPPPPPPTTTTNVSDAMSSLFDGWFSGAAGRLASGVRSTTTTTTSEGRFDSAAADPSSSSFDTVRVEREFASRGTLDADGNLPGAVRAGMPRPSVSLNLDGSLGGVDLDALLARLRTPEGLAELELERTRGNGDGGGDAVRADDVAFGLVDDDDGSAVPGLVPAAATAAARAEAASSSARATATRHSNASSIVGGREGGWGGAGRYESDEGWAREHARRGRGRGSRPRSAFVVANERSPRVDPTDGLGGAGAPRERTPATDPYGRGNARLRSARRSNAPGGPTPVTSLGGTGPRAPANESPSRAARGTRIDPATTIRIDARGTADPADEETDGEVDEEMEEWRRFRQTRARPESALASRRRPTVAPTVTPSSPGAVAADEAATAAITAAASAKAAATRANAEADARESRRVAIDSSVPTFRGLDFSSDVSSDGEAAASAGRGFGPGRGVGDAGSARTDMETETEREAETTAPGGDEGTGGESPPESESERASLEEAAESARSEGAASFRRGDYAAAIDAYTRALESSPDDATSLANRSAAHLRRGNVAAAEADATAALAIDPGRSDALRKRADARTAAGDLRGALADLEALHARVPTDERVTALLADARRSVAHADGATAAEMDRHDAERAVLAAARAEAWEAKRAAGLRAHGLRAASARASRRASETGKR